MTTYEVFEEELKETLSCLHDPSYQPSETLCQVIGCLHKEDNNAISDAILHVIESFKPPLDIPLNAFIRHIYDLLYNRYVLKLTQKETAYRLNVSQRTVNRLQYKAVHVLGRILWERSQKVGLSTRNLAHEDGVQITEGNIAEPLTPDWNSQLQRELNSLQAKAPDALSDVDDVIRSVLGIMNALTPSLGNHMKVMYVQQNLVAAIHPVLFQQVLLSVITRLIPYSLSEIAVYAKLEDGNTKITLTGTTGECGLNKIDLKKGIPTSKDISVDTWVEGTHAFVWITIPSMGKLTVLVIDDNEDMVHYYRDCTIGTRYHIVHRARGYDLFEVLRTLTPDIIVLDVMLPDIDGWHLLIRLHEEPATRSIPVIVCTVVREEDMAFSLGAASFLAKPVGPREFIHALDQVSSQAAKGGSIAPTNNGEAG